MFRLSRILSVAVVVFFVAGIPSFADYKEGGVEVFLGINWNVIEENESKYVPIEEVLGMQGDAYSFDREPFPNHEDQYTFSTYFSVSMNTGDEYGWETYGDGGGFLIPYITSNGIIVDSVRIVLDSDKYDDGFVWVDLDRENYLNFVIDYDKLDGMHQMIFMVRFTEDYVGQIETAQDFGFRFSDDENDSIIYGSVWATRNTTPEPATLLIFALASSAAAIPAVRRFRKK